MYQCKCVVCGGSFEDSNKRNVVCKTCRDNGNRKVIAASKYGGTEESKPKIDKVFNFMVEEPCSECEKVILYKYSDIRADGTITCPHCGTEKQMPCAGCMIVDGRLGHRLECKHENCNERLSALRGYLLAKTEEMAKDNMEFDYLCGRKRSEERCEKCGKLKDDGSDFDVPGHICMPKDFFKDNAKS